MIIIKLQEYDRLRRIEAIVRRLLTWPSIIGTQEWTELKEAVGESNYRPIEDELRAETKRLEACLVGCRIMLRDGYSHAEVIEKIGNYLGETEPSWPKA